MHPRIAALYSLGYTLFMSEKAIVATAIRGSDEVVRDVALQWSKTLCARCGVTIHVSGQDSVDWTRPVVLVSNHQSHFDTPVIMAGLDRSFGFMAKQELFRIPAFGTAMLRLGCVAIDRRDHLRAHRSLEQAAERIRTGASIVAFPEGTRSADGRLLAFKPGPFFLAAAAGVPVVPIGLVGTSRIVKKGTLLVRPGCVEVRVGSPISVPNASSRVRDELRREVRAQVLQLTGMQDGSRRASSAPEGAGLQDQLQA